MRLCQISMTAAKSGSENQRKNTLVIRFLLKGVTMGKWTRKEVGHYSQNSTGSSPKVDQLTEVAES